MPEVVHSDIRLGSQENEKHWSERSGVTCSEGGALASAWSYGAFPVRYEGSMHTSHKRLPEDHAPALKGHAVPEPCCPPWEKPSGSVRV